MRGFVRGPVLVGVAAVVAFLLCPMILAAEGPEVYSVIEGRDSTSSGPVVVLIGKGLTKFKTFLLTDVQSEIPAGTPEVAVSRSDLLTLRLPANLAPGTYELGALDKRGNESTFTLRIGNGAPFPGSVSSDSLAPSLRSALEDAGNLVAGVLSTDRFSAMADLQAESSIGTGATQVAAGNHDHDAVYAKRTLVGAKVHLGTQYTFSADQFDGTVNDNPIPLDVEDFDTDNCHSSQNPTRLTANTAGYYRVVGNLVFSSAVYPSAKIKRNGSMIAFTRVKDSDSSLLLETVLRLEAGDYVEMIGIAVRTDNPPQPNSLAVLKEGPGYTEFSMVRIGE